RAGRRRHRGATQPQQLSDPPSQRSSRIAASARYTPTTACDTENCVSGGEAVPGDVTAACGLAFAWRSEGTSRSEGRSARLSPCGAATGEPPPPTAFSPPAGPRPSSAGGPAASSLRGPPRPPRPPRGRPGRGGNQGTGRAPRRVSSIRRIRRAGSGQGRTARLPKMRITKLPRAAWASQYQSGVSQAMSFALRLLRLLLPARPGDQFLQVFQLVSAGVGCLQQAEHQLVHRPVEDLVEEAGGYLLAGVRRRVDKRPALLAVRHQALCLHDAEDGLDGIEVPLAAGVQVLMHLADTGRAQLPEHLEDLQLAFARNRLVQVILPGPLPTET